MNNFFFRNIVCLSFMLIAIHSNAYVDQSGNYRYPENDPVYNAGKTNHVNSYDKQNGAHVSDYNRHPYGSVCHNGYCN